LDFILANCANQAVVFGLALQLVDGLSELEVSNAEKISRRVGALGEGVDRRVWTSAAC
jgi:hypothetical protein